MTERKEYENTGRKLRVGHLGILAQAGAVFRECLRMLTHQGGWMVLAMAAALALAVGAAMREGFMHTMEGTYAGLFALTLLAIWNGSFNSIHMISREKGDIRRARREGMHVRSYMAAHILYQLLLCVMETAITLALTMLTGMQYTGKGLVTGWLVVDLGLTVFLAECAADLLALWVSTLCATAAQALAVLPFLLVFQVLSSGVLFALPDGWKPVTSLTVSGPAFRAMAAQANLNSMPVQTIEEILSEVENVEVSGKITLGQVLDSLSAQDNPSVSKVRSTKVGGIETIGELLDDLLNEKKFQGFRDRKLIGNLQVEDILLLLDDADAIQEYKGKKIGVETTIGNIVDYLSASPAIQSLRDQGFGINTTVGDLVNMVGREKTQKMISENVLHVVAKPENDHFMKNVTPSWINLLIIMLVFALLSFLTLSFTGKGRMPAPAGIVKTPPAQGQDDTASIQ